MLELTTARLVLRPLDADDVDALHGLWTDELVRKYLWDDLILTRIEVAEAIVKNDALFAEHGCGLWGARLANDDALIGFVGFWQLGRPPKLELVYGLHPSYWHRGLASELARAMLDFGFGRLGFDVIHASTDVPNTGSAKLLQRLGMTLDERKRVGRFDILFYSLTREAHTAGH